MINSVILEGRLVSVPTLTKTGNGRSCANFCVAHKREGYGKGVDYVHCVAWGKVADALACYKGKGDPVIVQGFMREQMYENWQKKDVKELIVTAQWVHFLAREPAARWADQYFKAYPEEKKKYNRFVREELHEVVEDELQEEIENNEFDS